MNAIVYRVSRYVMNQSQARVRTLDGLCQHNPLPERPGLCCSDRHMTAARPIEPTPPPRPATQGSSPGWGIPVLAGVVATAVVLAGTRLGIGATPDSGHYLATAENVLAGRGFVRLGGEIMASWPPLYPT